MPATSDTAGSEFATALHARGGPYTPQEFVALFGVVNEPPPLTVDPRLAAAALEVDQASADFDEAHDAWMTALVARGLATATNSAARFTDAVIGLPGNTPPRDTATPLPQAEVAYLRDRAEEARERLERVRGAYSNLDRRLAQQRIAASYAADVAEQAATRAAETSRRLGPTSARRKSILRRPTTTPR